MDKTIKENLEKPEKRGRSKMLNGNKEQVFGIQGIKIYLLCYFLGFVIAISPVDLSGDAKPQRVQQVGKKTESVQEAPPRTDLYQQITRQTGVSLRQVFNLVFKRGNAKRNKLTWNRLSNYVDQRGPQGIQQAYQNRIQGIQTFCDQNAGRIPGCHLQIEDIKKEQADFQAFRKRAKTDKKLALSYALQIFNHQVRSDVFEKAYADLARQCPMEKINSEACQSKRRSIHHLIDLTERLQQATSPHTRAKSKRKIAGQINSQITVYE